MISNIKKKFYWNNIQQTNTQNHKNINISCKYSQLTQLAYIYSRSIDIFTVTERVNAALVFAAFPSCCESNREHILGFQQIKGRNPRTNIWNSQLYNNSCRQKKTQQRQSASAGDNVYKAMHRLTLHISRMSGWGEHRQTG